MRLMLVHHADAVGPDVDPQRPLSALGLEQARRLADQAAATGFVPAAIWHSGKLRARQTAEAFLRLSPFTQFKMINGIRPDDPPDLLLDTLAHETRDVLVASHMPYLPDSARATVTGISDVSAARVRTTRADWRRVEGGRERMTVVCVEGRRQRAEVRRKKGEARNQLTLANCSC